MQTQTNRLTQEITKHPLIAGSFLLTIAGFVSRLIGFFYRIYLSQLFGEEGMGVYQLLSPVLALSFSLTAAGFQTAISKFVAQRTEAADHTESAAPSCKPLIMGLSLAIPVSVLLMFIMMQGSEYIAVQFLQEPRTASMLRILALSLPLSAAHACINGYFYGLKKAGIPAMCQLVEQCSRVLSVYLITTIGTLHGNTPTLNVTVIGLVMGEVISTLISIVALFRHLFSSVNKPLHSTDSSLTYKALLGMTIPLIANRITLNFLQSIETVSIPANLKLFGYDSSTALSVYGVLTGMAFPLIFFPNAITSSFAVLLLPLISERISVGDTAGVKKLTAKTIQYCSLLGFSCMAVFFFFGDFIGHFLFGSDLAGFFITALSFICPFIYLNNTLSAILQGMGKVLALFVINVAALLIRLLFIYTCIPNYGIQGYLWGLLVSQLFQSAAYLLVTVNYKKPLASFISEW